MIDDDDDDELNDEIHDETLRSFLHCNCKTCSEMIHNQQEQAFSSSVAHHSHHQKKQLSISGHSNQSHFKALNFDDDDEQQESGDYHSHHRPHHSDDVFSTIDTMTTISVNTINNTAATNAKLFDDDECDSVHDEDRRSLLQKVTTQSMKQLFDDHDDRLEFDDGLSTITSITTNTTNTTGKEPRRGLNKKVEFKFMEEKVDECKDEFNEDFEDEDINSVVPTMEEEEKEEETELIIDDFDELNPSSPIIIEKKQLNVELGFGNDEDDQQVEEHYLQTSSNNNKSEIEEAIEITAIVEEERKVNEESPEAATVIDQLDEDDQIAMMMMEGGDCVPSSEMTMMIHDEDNDGKSTKTNCEIMMDTTKLNHQSSQQQLLVDDDDLNEIDQELPSSIEFIENGDMQHMLEDSKEVSHLSYSPQVDGNIDIEVVKEIYGSGVEVPADASSVLISSTTTIDNSHPVQEDTNNTTTNSTTTDLIELEVVADDKPIYPSSECKHDDDINVEVVEDYNNDRMQSTNLDDTTNEPMIESSPPPLLQPNILITENNENDEMMDEDEAIVLTDNSSNGNDNGYFDTIQKAQYDKQQQLSHDDEQNVATNTTTTTTAIEGSTNSAIENKRKDNVMVDKYPQQQHCCLPPPPLHEEGSSDTNGDGGILHPTDNSNMMIQDNYETTQLVKENCSLMIQPTRNGDDDTIMMNLDMNVQIIQSYCRHKLDRNRMISIFEIAFTIQTLLKSHQLRNQMKLSLERIVLLQQLSRIRSLKRTDDTTNIRIIGNSNSNNEYHHHEFGIVIIQSLLRGNSYRNCFQNEKQLKLMENDYGCQHSPNLSYNHDNHDGDFNSSTTSPLPVVPASEHMEYEYQQPLNSSTVVSSPLKRKHSELLKKGDKVNELEDENVSFFPPLLKLPKPFRSTKEKQELASKKPKKLEPKIEKVEELNIFKSKPIENGGKLSMIRSEIKRKNDEFYFDQPSSMIYHEDERIKEEETESTVEEEEGTESIVVITQPKKKMKMSKPSQVPVFKRLELTDEEIDQIIGQKEKMNKIDEELKLLQEKEE